MPMLVDSNDRVENIDLCIDYILHHFDTNISVCEMGTESKYKNPFGVEYEFIKTDSDKNHKTKILNILARKCKTEFHSTYDVDVLLPVKAYIDGYNMLSSGNYDMVFPFDGRFFGVGRNHYGILRQNKNTDVLISGMFYPIVSDSVGGCVFWNTKSFISSGMENENFSGWGYEDTERYHRSVKLGLRIGRTSYPIFHVDHFRGPNSSHGEMYWRNKSIYDSITRMNADELRRHISEWKWSK